MEQLRNYGDTRQSSRCAYCVGSADTRNHVPSRVLLDEPYPANLLVVSACRRCNNSASLDEEYVACVVDCALIGQARPSQAHRPKVREILERKPAVAALVEQGRRTSDSGVTFAVDAARVRHVFLKLARGHAAFELNEPQFDEPSTIVCAPRGALEPATRAAFAPLRSSVWPEVGSRAMRRVATSTTSTWVTVQPGRYRYLTHAADLVVVRMVLSEWLYCEVSW